jgi:hypothetical protein
VRTVPSCTLLTGDIAKLEFTGGLPASMTSIFVGRFAHPRAFLGGTLVPEPERIIGPFLLDGVGALTVGGPWPAATPDGSMLWFHAWTLDAAGPQGLSASNALSSRSPSTDG